MHNRSGATVAGTIGILSLALCSAIEPMQPLPEQKKAEQLVQHLAKWIGTANPEDALFDDSPAFVLGDYLFHYIRERGILCVEVVEGHTYLRGAPAEEAGQIRRAVLAENDPAFGGWFERGGSYILLDEDLDRSLLVRDYPVRSISPAAFREGVEYQVNLAATWRINWSGEVARLVHQLPGAKRPTAPVTWDDEVGALRSDLGGLSGRSRAQALVRAFGRHRLVRGAGLDSQNRRDFGDFDLRYDSQTERLSAGVFVATPSDLRRLRAEGVTPAQLLAALNHPEIGGRFGRPSDTRWEISGPPEAPSLYLVGSWPVMALTPMQLHSRMEPLLDYGVVWRHGWVFRVASIVRGQELPPEQILQRTPADFGLPPTRGGLRRWPPDAGTPPDSAPPATGN